MTGPKGTLVTYVEVSDCNSYIQPRNENAGPATEVTVRLLGMIYKGFTIAKPPYNTLEKALLLIEGDRTVRAASKPFDAEIAFQRLV